MFIFKNSQIQVRFMGFSGGERHIQLTQLPPKTPLELALRVDLLKSDDIMDLLLLDNALTAHYQQQIPLNLEIPYLPYARQDRVCAQGQAFSLQVMTQLLNLLNIKQLLFWDVHSDVALKLTGANQLSPVKIMQQSPLLIQLLTDPNSVLICPDKGAINRTLAIQQAFNIKTLIQAEKKREATTGKILKTVLHCDDLTTKTAIICDDICDGGMTFIKIAEVLKAKGAEKIILYITHGIFSRGLVIFEHLIDEIFTTQSFPQTKHPKLTVIQVEQ